MKTAGTITLPEWNFFLRGPTGGLDKQNKPKPERSQFVTLNVWKMACELSDTFECFHGIHQDLTKTPVWIRLGETFEIRANPPADKYPYTDPAPPEYVPGSKPSEDVVNGYWNERLSPFQKLMFVKVFREEKTTFAITEFVAQELGPQFVESPAVALAELYESMNKVTPLVFVLSTGSDPMGSFLRFAKEMGLLDNVQSISLGQGQGPVAENMVKTATKSGDWVFLQNCHLAASWMLAMEEIIKELQEFPTMINSNFRLFLSSMPAKHFPVSVLQNSVKVTNEPPKGIRANLRRAFSEMTQQFFEEHPLGIDWRRIIFGICFFHAVILERKKFGPLGWNITYAFSDSDRECALLNLEMFCADKYIPWDALIYITGEITYGGRVTDAQDQRCLRTVLKIFFKQDTLDMKYKYSESGIYYAPSFKTITAFRNYIESLPIIDEPEIFGLHENANIAFEMKETHTLLGTILEVQPRVSGDDTGLSNDDIVYAQADNILERLVDKLDIDAADPAMFLPDSKGRQNSLTIVVTQEAERFNKLLKVIKRSLDQLKKAIKGFVVMSEELEMVYNAFLNNQVPGLWGNAAYPSLKTLASWVKDLVMRCAFVQNWISHGNPKSYWLSGFFFPQGFLTGALQNFARKYNLPIDHLSFKFNMLQISHQEKAADETAERKDTLPQDGKRGMARYSTDDPHQLAQLPTPDDGVLVHGLFMDGFAWDWISMVCCDMTKGQMNSSLPVMHMDPKMDYEPDSWLYAAPLYKTSARAGTLSTTGHSTNYVVAVYLPSSTSQDYWIAKGAALLCQLSD